MIIYKITNKSNNKIYIGQTVKSARHRFNHHFRNKNLKGISGALTKYGKDNFLLETIDSAISKKELDEKEIYWIEYYKTLDRNKGYNLIEGGGKYNENHEYKKGKKHTSETKKKMSENGIKGRIKLHSISEDREIFILKHETIPCGFVEGELPSKSKRISETMSKKKSYHNPLSGESIRIEGTPPKGFVAGRGEFNNNGTKGMSWYHLNEKEILAKEKPDDNWFDGKLQTHYLVYSNTDLLGEYAKNSAIKEFGNSIIKSTKEKPIGSNKAYRSRLSAPSCNNIGYYWEEIKK